ncbi:MAG: FIST signal transduction protein [Aquabacterium sp.]|uniref:FIST signal transduction protein n=1 Tax=Aquabacterium sp. TaxID=1872578 RepID=UPI003BE88773
MSSGHLIRIGHSTQPHTRDAVLEFCLAVDQPDLALVLFFCSDTYDLDVVAAELSTRFSGIPVLGCSTAGEIGPQGCRDHSISGASFSKAGFAATVCCIDALHDFEVTDGKAFVTEQLRQLSQRAPTAEPQNTFALMLIDGLSMAEEKITRSLQNALGRIRLIGGSAGDGMDFSKTLVYWNGTFQSDRAAMVLVSTPHPFEIFKIQHFLPTSERLVVTAADTSKRLVTEINGLPAAQEYARLIGVPVEALSTEHFAAVPLLVLIDGTSYTRSIQKVNADGSLTFFCAIEEGIVMRVAQSEDILSNMQHSFEEIARKIGRPTLTIGFDCILRKLENQRLGLNADISEVFSSYHTVGLNTYGEQYCGVHVTQTLTGVAIGDGRG